MSKENRWVPLYQRLGAGGNPTHKLAGVSAALKTGDDATKGEVTWLVAAAPLNGLVPVAGDFLRDTAGRWWVVAGVGPLAAESHPLRCTRWEEK